MRTVLTIILGLFVLTVNAQKSSMELATFGSGCFWCADAIFARVKGVVEVKPGYSGGKAKNPTYKQVCTGTTGHAEVVQVKYNPAEISYADLLKIFFETHDPTQLNRQGNDVGTQYRSIILYHNDNQKATAQKIIDELTVAMIWEKPIVTQLVPFDVFYSAESYHDDYYTNNPNQGYCRYVITPKLEKFEKIFKDYMKTP